jgi:hypothetical protein
MSGAPLSAPARLLGVALSSAFCASLAAIYVVLEPIPYWKVQALILGVPVLAAAASFAALAVRALRPLAATAPMLAALLVPVLALEAAFVAAPGLFPDNLRMIVEGEPEIPRQAMVLRHTASPYATLRPDTRIRVPGYYGPETAFEYEWTTDKRGFKNDPAVAARENFDVVALGDSFTEAMGVPIRQGWVHLLNERGFAAYSLGVQGYAPSQFVGAYDMFGAGLGARWIVVGYLTGTSARESVIRARRDGADGLPSAIGRLDAQDRVRDRPTIAVTTEHGEVVTHVLQSRYVFAVTGLFNLARVEIATRRAAERARERLRDDPRFFAEAAGAQAGDIAVPGWRRYRGEFESFRLETQGPDALAADEDWRDTLAALEAIAERARRDGARLVLLVLRSRAEIYFERAFGRPPPENAIGETQARALRDVAARLGVASFDMASAFRACVARFPADAPASAYPYLIYDGHLSAVGNRWLADFVAARLRSLEDGRQAPTDSVPCD